MRILGPVTAADRDGTALYADIGAVPHILPARQRAGKLLQSVIRVPCVVDLSRIGDDVVEMNRTIRLPRN